MTREEVTQLCLRAQAGDAAAEETLIRQFEGLVGATVQRWGKGIRFQEDADLMQEGRIGLLSAIRAYDPTRGAAFTTFAIWRIAGVVRRAKGRDNLIRRPGSIPYSIDIPFVALSLDGSALGPTMDGEGTPVTLADQCEDGSDAEAQAIDLMEGAHIRAVVSRMRDCNARRAVWLYFGLDGRGRRTFREIAELTQCSTNGASERVKRGLEQLRSLFEADEETNG